VAYVGPDFTHDIFLSYSHGDPDGTGVSKLKEWSLGFASELESELKENPKFANEIRIFCDEHPRPAQAIDPMSALPAQLQNDVGRAAILAVLLSPHYLKSAWCQREREWWWKQQETAEIDVDGRIALIRIWPSDPPPDPLKDLVGFYFYDRPQAGAEARPYEWPRPGPSSRDPFRKELLNLVGWLGLKLDRVRDELQERRRRSEEIVRMANSGQAIYLHGRAEFSSAWDRAADALSQSGFAVLPGEPDPVVGDAKAIQELREKRVETMSGCDALLLVAADSGRAVDADLVVVGRQDRNSARSLSRKLLPCALLDAAGSVATPRRRVAARSLNVEWIDASHDPWTPAVQQWLTEIARAEARP
jgi:hypothetical protein